MNARVKISIYDATVWSKWLLLTDLNGSNSVIGKHVPTRAMACQLSEEDDPTLEKLLKCTAA